ncbi:gamma subclass chorismate mutase AroQ [Streptomyces gamaensis]|uniref:chorismate mutase n=1 Tax=Streptomyces gamaensis TaxID=1763542 RepID=A0ABW0Z7U0_9ACTN
MARTHRPSRRGPRGRVPALAAVTVAAVLTSALPAQSQAAADPPEQLLTALALAAGERLRAADDLAAATWLSAQPVVDPAREQHVLDAMDEAAVRRDIDPLTVRRIFRDQIAAGTYVQRQLHAHWHHFPDEAPTTAPELSEVHARVDAIDTRLLAAIGRAEELLDEPECGRLRDRARATAIDALDLDPGHARGLRRALAGVCAADAAPPR